MKHVPTLTAMVVQPGESTPRVSSLQIAEAFDKNHQHVLRRIRELMKSCPTQFTKSNFGLSNFLDTTGRELPQYLLTRDAFSLLVMGFTGEKALFWKIRYIEAFNDMEKALLSKKLLAAPEGRQLIHHGLRLAKRLTPARRREIKRAVRYRDLGLSKGEIGRLLGRSRTTVRLLLQDHSILKGGAQ